MKTWLAILLLLVLIASSASVYAQTGGDYELTWLTIDGGGGTAFGGAYQLDGTVGQPDAATSSGGAYQLNSGFWVIEEDHEVYLPLIMHP